MTPRQLVERAFGPVTRRLRPFPSHVASKCGEASQAVRLECEGKTAVIRKDCDRLTRFRVRDCSAIVEYGLSGAAAVREHRSSLRALPAACVLLAVAATLGTGSSVAFGQGGVTVVPNEALFSVLAAINLAGYDSGLDSEPATGVRHEARAWCAKRQPEVLPALARFYHDHQLADSSADLGQYLSLALLLGPPPDFNPTVADADLPPDGAAVKEIVPLLQRFYREAGVKELWTRLQPVYESTINDWSGPIRQSITTTDAYLRFPAGAYLGRTYTINIGLLSAPGQVQARIYGENYYVVATSSQDPPIADVRHQYLHFLLDPLALKFAFEVRQKEGLAALARPAPALGIDFREDFSLLLTECLIRAVEFRMDKPPQPEKQVDEITKEGLILVPYFYEALGDFANQPASMSTYYRQMVMDIAIPKERQRLANVKFAPAAEVKVASHPVVHRTADDTLLDQADNLIYQGNYAEAKTVFSNVLSTDARNERALFGMAVVASNTRKPDTAEDYFKKTLEVARSSRIAAWSHIYLARIYDLEGNRKQALIQYRAASLAAGAFPDAWRAVQAGLAQPFGDKP